jgi:hypothetical protein
VITVSRRSPIWSSSGWNRVIVRLAVHVGVGEDHAGDLVAGRHHMPGGGVAGAGSA